MSRPGPGTDPHDPGMLLVVSLVVGMGLAGALAVGSPALILAATVAAVAVLTYVAVVVRP